MNDFKHKQHPAQTPTKLQSWKLWHCSTMMLLVPQGTGIALFTNKSFFTHHRLLDFRNSSEQQHLHPFFNCNVVLPFQLQGKGKSTMTPRLVCRAQFYPLTCPSSQLPPIPRQCPQLMQSFQRHVTAQREIFLCNTYTPDKSE